MAKKSTIAVILGTRPEIIKMAPVIRHLKKTKKPFFVIHTGQHYSFEMDRVFFRDLELPAPEHQLSIRSIANRHGDHIARMLIAIESILLKERPLAVLTQGDTNTVLAGSLAAAKIPGIRLGHVEAGLRSYDRAMPEETNRIISDHVSDFLFAPTALSARTLRKEGISSDKIFITGNTIVDAVRQNLAIAERKRSAQSLLDRYKGGYFLMTLHRQENVDRKEVLKGLLKGLESVIQKRKKPILFFAHPRTTDRLKKYRLRLPEGIEVLPPAGFLEFLRLEKNAGLLLTDSGGVQEEGCILGVPCVTLRTTTERPETVAQGANLIAGHEPSSIVRAAERMLARRRKWRNPFGDGRCAERIVGIVERQTR